MKELQLPGLSRRTVGDGIEVLDISNPLASASVALNGAHVMGFTPVGERPVLWMSRKSPFTPGTPISGGVPICWPWFGPSSFGGHGYARRSQWSLAGAENLADGATRLEFAFEVAPGEQESTPQLDFSLRYSVTVGSALELVLTMVNRGDAPAEIGGALHSYFSVADIRRVAVRGLDGTDYTEQTSKMSERIAARQQGEIRFSGEVDRVFAPSRATVRIVDEVWKRTIRVEKFGSASTVVWNPWIDKAAAMPNLGDEEYQFMLCVEAANARTDSRVILPGATHSLAQKISLEAFPAGE